MCAPGAVPWVYDDAAAAAAAAPAQCIYASMSPNGATASATTVLSVVAGSRHTLPSQATSTRWLLAACSALVAGFAPSLRSLPPHRSGIHLSVICHQLPNDKKTPLGRWSQSHLNRRTTRVAPGQAGEKWPKSQDEEALLFSFSLLSASGNAPQGSKRGFIESETPVIPSIDPWLVRQTNHRSSDRPPLRPLQ